MMREILERGTRQTGLNRKKGHCWRHARKISVLLATELLNRNESEEQRRESLLRA